MFALRTFVLCAVMAVCLAVSKPTAKSPLPSATTPSFDWNASKLINMFSEAINATASAIGGRSGKSNFDGAYGMWNPQGAAGKFDVLSLIPTLLIVGIGIMLLPVIISCFTQIIAPLNYSNGRKKRDTGTASIEDLLPSSTTGIIFDLLATFNKAAAKYNF